MLFFVSLLAGLLAGKASADEVSATQVARTAPPVSRYWVTFRDKAGQQFQPATYFASQARLRRQRQGLPAADSTDFPVRPDYVARIQSAVDTVTLVSRWFNAVSCKATPAQARVLRDLPGVKSVVEWPEEPLLAAGRPAAQVVASSVSTADRSLARRQTASLGATEWRKAGLDGRGLRIAIFDVGFTGTDKHQAFAHLRRRKAIVATYDFLRQSSSVYQGGDHGTEVLSCIAGRLPDSTNLGLAPGAEFLLARTERMHREKYAEEEAWLAAAEWADKNGADIINSSLGYTNRRYFPEQMNGRTSLVARAAELAARKGMLVVNAAGNDGDDPQWRTVGTPADGDSVLAVGGLDPDTYLHVEFSSYGPAAGRRLKPNVAAFGVVLAAAPGGGYVRTEGTSFSSPLVAGFAACAWQQRRDLTAMQLFQQLQQSANLHPYFDYAHGYGLPQATFFTAPRNAAPASFDFVRQDTVVAVIIRQEAAYVPARMLPLFADSTRATTLTTPTVEPVGKEQPQQNSFPAQPSEAVPPTQPDYFYWQILDRSGFVRRYEVLEVSQRAVLRLPLRRLRPGDTIRVHYRGYTQTYSAS